MLEQLKYQNHRGEVIEFGKYGVYVNTSELHDYSWNVTKKNDRISSLDYTVTTRKLPIVIMCATEAEGIAARNRLHEVMEKDVLAFQYGRVIIGDYYFKCFVTKSVKKDYQNSKRYMAVTLTLTTDFPYWVKETSTVFMPAQAAYVSGVDLDYPHDYPHDYANDTTARTIVNSGFVPSNFRLNINGPCSNPAVYVAGHLYQVYCDVAEGEYLTIDSVSKTITLTAVDGTKTNKFNDRNKASYIFEKIPAGKHDVSWSGDFVFEVIVLDERSEPKWT